MPVFERISRWITQRRSAESPVVPLDAAGVKVHTVGVSVNNHSALNITALYAGIRIISENVASFPKYIKKDTAEGWVNDKSHPAFALINQRPNSYTNKFDFWNCIVTWLTGWGNAYAIIKWGSGGVAECDHSLCRYRNQYQGV